MSLGICHCFLSVAATWTRKLPLWSRFHCFWPCHALLKDVTLLQPGVTVDVKPGVTTGRSWEKNSTHVGLSTHWRVLIGVWTLSVITYSQKPQDKCNCFYCQLMNNLQVCWTNVLNFKHSHKNLKQHIQSAFSLIGIPGGNSVCNKGPVNIVEK